MTMQGIFSMPLSLLELGLLEMVADTAIKATVLCFVAICASVMLRHSSSAVRHRIWTAAFLCLLALPCLSAVLPKWRVPVMPRLMTELTLSNAPVAVDGGEITMDPLLAASPTESSNHLNNVASPKFQQPPLTPFSGFGGSPADTFGDSVNVEHAEDRLRENPAQIHGNLSSSTRPGVLSSAAHWFVIIAVLGMSLCLAPVCAGAAHILLLQRRASEVKDPEYELLVDQLRSVLVIRRSVRLYRATRNVVPMTWGILRPVVLLPADCETWPERRRRMVLLHELAHVKRLDLPLQLLARLACALYWFHPLVWYALARMQIEREQACDDCVIAAGVRASDYATQLVDIAETHRAPSTTMAVAMARSSRLESRLRMLFDHSKSRLPLNNRRRIAILIVSCGIVVLLAAVQPVSRTLGTDESTTDASGLASADSIGEQSKEQSKTSQEEVPVLREMVVHAQDENGAPMAGVQIHVYVSESKYLDDPRTVPSHRDFETRKDGNTVITIPRRLRILRLWAKKRGHVRLITGWEEGQHESGRLIPGAFSFEMTKGMRIGGTIRDESGKPVQGTQVEVRIARGSLPVNPKVKFGPSTSLTSEDPVLTDAGGRWRVDTAPGASYGDPDLRIKITHPGYISDETWGVLQQQQNVTTAALREQSALIVLKRGFIASGRVVNEANQPIATGIVVWNGRSSNVARFGSNGEFSTVALKPGTHRLTFVAPGYAPLMQEVLTSEQLDDLTIRLRVGKKLKIRVVDAHGRPVPRAWVGLGDWRETESLSSFQRSNSLDSGIPNRADEKGIYTWDWAPDDGVRYQIAARGFDQNTVELTATDSEHVVILQELLTISGTVTDAITGELVPKFRVVPVNVWNFLSAEYQNAVEGVDGKYQIERRDFSQDNRKHRLRIEADGYRSILSAREFSYSDGATTQDFTLRPAPAQKGTVVDSAGRPVSGASVVFATPSVMPRYRTSEVDRRVPQEFTDVHGHFELAAESEPRRIRITHASGFADVRREIGEPIGTIKLGAWASVRGRLFHDGEPLSGQVVGFLPFERGTVGQPRFQSDFTVMTTSEGEFAIERLPPVPGCIRVHVTPWEESALTSGQSIPLNLKAGENVTLALGGTGVEVAGQVIPTGRNGAELDMNYSLNYLISREQRIAIPTSIRPTSFDPREPVSEQWFIDPVGREVVTTRDHYFVKLSPSGGLRIEGVPPGAYDLSIRLYEEPSGCLVESIGHRVLSVEITADDIAIGTKSLGRIEVACRTGPRIGQNMQDYRFDDSSGRGYTVKDVEGRHVLLQLWATWCQPCLKSMPSIKNLHDSMSADNLILIGLNIDEDRERARELAVAQEWDWAQNYVGDQSRIARQLAISTIPAYFLIGPDGTLVATSTSWGEMSRTLQERGVITAP